MNNRSVLSNFIWRFAERCGARGVSFIVSIVLARLLAPEVYGTIALVTVFTTILNVFVDSGFGSALIQKKDADDLDFSTVFYFNITICSFLYILMFAAAPLIAEFYKDLSLTPVIRVLSLTLVISGVKNVQQAYVSRTMQFKRFFFATLGGTVGAAVIGIAMAYYGFGVWALVVQQIFNATVDTIILWITVKWRPKRMFSWNRLKGLFSYGWRLLVASLVNTIYGKVRQLIIGVRYSAADLAFYSKGDQFPYFIIQNINSSIDSVLLPVLSRAQDEKANLKAMTRRAIKTSTYIISPFMIGLTVIAEPLIRFILTEKWLPCVLYLRIFCIVYMLLPLQTANLNAIKATGHSEIFLKLEIIKKIIGLSAMLITIFISVEVMAYSYLITTILSAIINAFPNRKLLGYTMSEQIADILPSIMASLLMGAMSYSIMFLKMSDAATVCAQIIVGVLTYLGVSHVFKLEPYRYLLSTVQNFLKKGENK